MINLGKQIDEHIFVIEAIRPLIGELEAVAHSMFACLNAGGCIYWMGNGGSAADSQHLAAELVGRFNRERRGLPSIALTTDTSVLTSLGNDYGYEKVFARQVEALCRPRDVVVGISTSGRSPNVVAALKCAKDIQATTVAFVGRGETPLSRIAEYCLAVPTTTTARIQEAHILMGHLLCDWIEDHVVSENRSA